MSLRRSMKQLRPARTPKVDLQEKVQLFLTEADTTSATYVEMAICVAYNKLKKSKTPVKDAGIDEKNWAKVSEPLRKTGKLVAAKMGNRGSRLIHSGTGSATNKYKQGTDTTPKADFVGDGNNRISLKKAGDSGAGAQLMSAKSGEAAGVVKAAIDHFQKNSKVKLSNNKDFKDAMKILEVEMAKTARNDFNVAAGEAKLDFEKWFMTQSSRKKELQRKGKPKDVEAHLKAELSILGATRVSKGAESKLIKGVRPITKSQLKKYETEYINDNKYKVGDIEVSAKYLKNVPGKELENAALKKQVVDIIETSVASKPWKAKLEQFFNNNEDLKKWLVYEAASGLYKFTGNVSDGKRYTGQQEAVANKILVFTDTGIKSEYNVIDYAMANPQLVNKIDISYKASARSKYIKFGIAASVEHELPVLNEQLALLEGQYLLNEGIFSNIANKAKAFVNQAKTIIKNFYERVIKRFFVRLYELADEGLKVLFEALGIDISNANVKMKTPSW